MDSKTETSHAQHEVEGFIAVAQSNPAYAKENNNTAHITLSLISTGDMLCPTQLVEKR